MTDGEQCFLLDLKHGIVLFSGSRPEMDERLRSLLVRCKELQIEKEAQTSLCILRETEVNKDEFNYMIDKRWIPRRLSMRLIRGKTHA
jgi:hypothetical protein